MSETVENLVLGLLVWLLRPERTYKETMEAWRTSCPRLPFARKSTSGAWSRQGPTTAASWFASARRPRVPPRAQTILSVANHYF